MIVRLAPNEVIDHLFDVSESSYYGKNPCYIAVSNRRLILITGDLKGGVYWPLKTTRAVRVETGKMLSKWSRFVFISTVANSAERYVQFEDKKDASIVETIFNANVELKEYSTVFIKNRNNALAVFNEECNTVVRFSKALKVCSQNLKAMFIWLMSMVGLWGLVHCRSHIFRWLSNSFVLQRTHGPNQQWAIMRWMTSRCWTSSPREATRSRTISRWRCKSPTS